MAGMPEATGAGDGTPAAGRHRVVIVGGGFGGLFAARVLKRAPVDVTLVDRVNHHLFQPLLYQVATGILSEGQIAPPLRNVLRRQRNTRVELAQVVGFDLDRRTVSALRADAVQFEIPYDSLIVAAGAGQSYFGHDEFSRWAPGMKTIDDALELRARILGAFEMAALLEDPEKRRAWLTFVVVGGGPTGVEISGQIAELAHRVLPSDFKDVDPTSARVLLFDGGKEILAGFGDRLSAKGAKELERQGVEIHTESIVTNVDRRGVEVKGGDGEVKRVRAQTKVWAAGVQASPLAKLLADACGAECDRAGRVPVLPDCTLPDHPEVFAIGDMMALDNLPGVAEVAMQQGIHSSATIKRRFRGADSRPFRYRDLGSMATISRFRAVVSFKGIRVAGFVGWLTWLFVHLAFMTGFKNRFITVLQWGLAFIGKARNERTLTMQQAIARVAIQEAGGQSFLLRLTAEDVGQAPEGERS
ncbi:MAG TPA: NAD(P)/FAD-dependent oxidoreductase [Solirubrobacterales bacterium]|nr:NAD(P)/FAD-dependent oxidoreductase [Solirubrobacterales bacterium]